MKNDAIQISRKIQCVQMGKEVHYGNGGSLQNLQESNYNDKMTSTLLHWSRVEIIL